MSEIKTVRNEITNQICNTAKLSNGLTVYHIPSEFSTSHALFGVDYGSVDTSYFKKGKLITVPDGTAHFLEHKLFDNKTGPVDDVFTSLGASCNAYTSFSSTAYTFSCTDNFLQCLNVLLDFVTNPYFTDETVKKEQGIISEEIKMYDDSPFWRCYFNMLKGMYGDVPVAKDIAGTVDSISKITPEILYSLISDFYATENMRLCIYGGCDFDSILSSAEKIQRTAFNVERSPLKIKNGVITPTVKLNMETSKPILYIGIKDDGYGKTRLERTHRSTVFQAVFNMLFSESSDFFTKLYSSGLITDRLQYAYEDENGFAFGTVCCETDSPETVYDEFCRYTDSIVKNGVNAEDFEISKRIVHSDFIRTFDSGDSLPGELFVQGESLFEKTSFLSGVTVDEANVLVKKFFNTDNFVCSVLGTNVE